MLLILNVKSYPQNYVELDVVMKKVKKNVMRRSSHHLLISLKKFVISIHRKHADMQQNLFQN